MLRPSRNIIAEKVVITSLNAADATYSEPLRLEQFWNRLFAADHEQSDGDFETVVRRYHERRIGAAGALAALVFGDVETPNL